jgi:hypothetical protein
MHASGPLQKTPSSHCALPWQPPPLLALPVAEALAFGEPPPADEPALELTPPDAALEPVALPAPPEELPVEALAAEDDEADASLVVAPLASGVVPPAPAPLGDDAPAPRSPEASGLDPHAGTHRTSAMAPSALTPPARRIDDLLRLRFRTAALETILPKEQPSAFAANSMQIWAQWSWSLHRPEPKVLATDEWLFALWGREQRSARARKP